MRRLVIQRRADSDLYNILIHSAANGALTEPTVMFATSMLHSIAFGPILRSVGRCRKPILASGA